VKRGKAFPRPSTNLPMIRRAMQRLWWRRWTSSPSYYFERDAVVERQKSFDKGRWWLVK
jgi:hypothetical protein